MKQKLDDLVMEMIDGGIHYADARREFEKRFLSRVIELSNGNLSRAAKDLGIHRNTLRKKIEELKLKSPRRR